jgi:hypothetical protein
VALDRYVQPRPSTDSLDDALLPGDVFFTPIMLILEGAGSQDPTTERIADTWLKVNLGSHTRFAIVWT